MRALDRLADTLEIGADKAARSAVELWLRETRATPAERKLLVARHIAARNGQAYNQGRIALQIEAYRATGIDAGLRALAVMPIDMGEVLRIARAIETILEGGDVTERLERLARAENIKSAQHGYGAALRDDERVIGWSRGLEPDACELCEHWYEGGKIFPKSAQMATHPNCQCTQEPEYK